MIYIQARHFRLFLLTLFVLTQSSLAYTEKDLHEHIAKNTVSRWERPVSLGEKITVTTHFFLLQILAVDSAQQSIEFAGTLWAHWYDNRVKWDTAHFNTTSVLYPAEKIWVPEYDIANAVGDTESIQAITDTDGKIDSLTIFHTGTCFIKSKFKVKIACTLDILNFPIDTQDCQLIIGPLDASMHLNITTSKHLKIEEFYLGDEQWSLIQTHSFIQTYSQKLMDNITQNWNTLNVKVLLRREPTYYYYNIVFPIFYLGILLLISFVIPSASGEKINLGITILLALSVFMLLLDQLMPKVKTIPYLGQYISAVMGITMLTIIATACILVFHHQSSDRRMPRLLYFFIFHVLGTALCQSKAVLKLSKMKKSVSGKVTRLAKQGAWSQNDDKKTKSLKDVQDGQESSMIDVENPVYSSKTTENNSVGAPTEDSSDEVECRNFWHEGAAILDKFCFVFGILTIVAVTVVFLAVLPFTYHYKKYPDD